MRTITQIPAVSQSQVRDLLFALQGAEKCIVKALPFCPPDNEAVYLGEWLGEIRTVIAAHK